MYILHIVQGLWFTSRLLVGNEGSEKKVEVRVWGVEEKMECSIVAGDMWESIIAMGII